jgi:hypothetical protein
VMTSSDSIYREAVMSHSPGLPCFTATLGTKHERRQPQRGCVGLQLPYQPTMTIAVNEPNQLLTQRHNPFGVENLPRFFPG